MSAFVNIHEAKTHLSRLVDRAHGGEEIILAKGGKPWARLVPLAVAKAPIPRRPGGWPVGPGHDHLAILEKLTPEELGNWDGEAAPVGS